jgi:hypothetical protein
LEPRAGQRQATLWVQRQGERSLVPLSVDVSGYAPLPASGWALGLSWCAALALALLMGRGLVGAAIGWLQTQLVEVKAKDAPLDRFVRPKEPRRSGRGLFAFCVCSMAFASMSLGLLRKLSEVDLVLVFGAFALLLGTNQLLGGGLSVGGWSLWRALRAVLRSYLFALCVLFALVPAALFASSLSLREIVELQASVTAWNLFRTPSSLLGAGVLLTLLVLHALGTTLVAHDDEREPFWRRQALRCVRQLETLQLGLLSGLFVTTYAGGWALPAFISGGHGPLGPALFFQLKFTFVYFGMLWLQQRLPRVGNTYLWRVYLRFVMPCALLACVSAPIWTVAAWPKWLHETFAWTAMSVTLGLLAWLSSATLRRSERPPPALNPWL